jgi:hypothetical protein
MVPFRSDVVVWRARLLPIARGPPHLRGRLHRCGLLWQLRAGGSTVKRIIVTFLAFMTGALAGATPVAAEATTVTTNTQFEVSFPVFVPCANAGAGEFVVLSGTQHQLFHLTTDDQGGLHLKSTIQSQGISGIGLTTGDKYQGTGPSQSETNITVGSQQTLINSFKVIGQGPGNNFLVQQTTHITVTANGDLTAFVNDFSVECR